MALNLVKLCVGIDSPDQLLFLQQDRLARGQTLFHRTRMCPKRRDELLTGGSLYWVMKGQIRARQVLTDIVTRDTDEGRKTDLMLGDALILTDPMPKRAFQGWRYLKQEDTPGDLLATSTARTLPAHIVRELKENLLW